MNDYTTAIYAPIYKEYRLDEWMRYHYYVIGIQLFVLFDDNEDYNELPSLLSKNNIPSNWFVILRYDEITHDNRINMRYAGSQHLWLRILSILNNHQINYLLRIDADEFLYLDKYPSIKEFISDEMSIDVVQIHIFWRLVQNYSIELMNESNSLIYSYNITQRSNKLVTTILPNRISRNSFYKSITKVSLIDGIDNPHKCELKSNAKANLCSNNEIYIAHYALQDVTSCIKKRFLSYIYYDNKTSKSTQLIDQFISLIKENMDEFIYYNYYILSQINKKNYSKNYQKYIENINNNDDVNNRINHMHELFNPYFTISSIIISIYLDRLLEENDMVINNNIKIKMNNYKHIYNSIFNKKIFVIGFNNQSIQTIYHLFSDNFDNIYLNENLTTTINDKNILTNINSHIHPILGDLGTDYQVFMNIESISWNFKLIDQDYPESLFILNNKNVNDWVVTKLNDSETQYGYIDWWKRNNNMCHLSFDEVIACWKDQYLLYNDSVITYFNNPEKQHQLITYNVDTESQQDFVNKLPFEIKIPLNINNISEIKLSNICWKYIDDKFVYE